MMKKLATDLGKFLKGECPSALSEAHKVAEAFDPLGLGPFGSSPQPLSADAVIGSFLDSATDKDTQSALREETLPPVLQNAVPPAAIGSAISSK